MAVGVLRGALSDGMKLAGVESLDFMVDRDVGRSWVVRLCYRADSSVDRDGLGGDRSIRAVDDTRSALVDGVNTCCVDSPGLILWRRSILSSVTSRFSFASDWTDSGVQRNGLSCDRSIGTVNNLRRALGDGVDSGSADGAGGHANSICVCGIVGIGR